MIDARLRQALEAVDELVFAISNHETVMTTVAPARLIVDVGRAAAEWQLSTAGPDSRPVRLAVVCDIENDTVTDVRLYLGIESDTERGERPRINHRKD